MKETLDERNSIVESQRTQKARAVSVFSSCQWQKMKLEREVMQAERKTQEIQNEERVVELSELKPTEGYQALHLHVCFQDSELR
jgi:hypothetical protein